MNAAQPVRRDIARVAELGFAPILRGPVASIADEVRALDSAPPTLKCVNAGCLRPVASRGFCALCAVRMGVYDGR